MIKKISQGIPTKSTNTTTHPNSQIKHLVIIGSKKEKKKKRKETQYWERRRNKSSLQSHTKSIVSKSKNQKSTSTQTNYAWKIGENSSLPHTRIRYYPFSKPSHGFIKTSRNWQQTQNPISPIRTLNLCSKKEEERNQNKAKRDMKAEGKETTPERATTTKRVSKQCHWEKQGEIMISRSNTMRLKKNIQKYLYIFIEIRICWASIWWEDIEIPQPR